METYNFKRIAINILIGTLAVSSILFFFRVQKFSMFPFTEDFVAKGYEDHADKGNSEAELKTNPEQSLELTYTLGGKFEYPYVGIALSKKNPKQYFDINDYSSVSLKIKAEHTKIIRINIKTYCEKFSNIENSNSYMSNVYELKYSPEEEEYEIPLKEFSTPDWWYRDNQIDSIGSKMNCAFSNTQSVEIENCAFLPTGIKDKITLSSFAFTAENLYYLYTLIIGLILSIIAFLIGYTKKKKTVFVTYQPTPEINNGNDALEKKVFDYIAANYSNPELSLSLINKETGYNENKISAIIKTKYNQSFKQYINNIRMTEAKRLLNESEANISEIAYSIGYNNVTHFNRVFKSETGIAPGDYRKQKEEKAG